MRFKVKLLWHQSAKKTIIILKHLIHREMVKENRQDIAVFSVSGGSVVVSSQFHITHTFDLRTSLQRRTVELYYEGRYKHLKNDRNAPHPLIINGILIFLFTLIFFATLLTLKEIIILRNIPFTVPFLSV